MSVFAMLLMAFATFCFVVEALSQTPAFAKRFELMPIGLAAMAGSFLLRMLF